jgi:uncharacterized protein YjbI with pentapeptide repeats
MKVIPRYRCTRRILYRTYVSRKKELPLERDLRDSGPDSSARAVANVQTLVILERLDGSRKRAVLRLLTDSHLIDADAPLIETPALALQVADAEGMDLSDTDLSRADLSEANLKGANLEGANLSSANLSNATIYGANLSDANLSNANLSGANLSEASLSVAILYEAEGITNEELAQQAAFLEGATMPNGQKHGAWLRDREARKEEGKSSGSS